MNPHVELAAEALGATPTKTRRLTGGDINHAFAVTLSDGREIFVKINGAAPKDMFAVEADGLAWLGEAVTTPEVLAVGPSFLALELVVSGPKRPNFDATLGRALAHLHARGAGSFGFSRDGYIGTLPQQNQNETDWATFYEDHRLRPLVARAGRLLSASTRDAFERLYARLPDLVGDAEPPARLHGDLWSGNMHVSSDGAPCFIDPAPYAGHREIDLAMMRLFGGFSPRVFSAYKEAYPLSSGADDRVPLYQLYPLLAHVNLFGGGYVSATERALFRYVGT